jgi:molybdenum cofactor biosynthesis protein MoaC
MSNEHQTLLHASSMADVSGKPVTRRRALASGKIMLGAEAFSLVVDRKLPKGDALSLAEYAGMQGAKQTSTLLPLCHPISLDRVSLFSVARADEHAVEIFCLAEINERTGVEMEALCGLSVALLTVWDLAKPINPALEIGGSRLLYKSGGKRGTWRHPGGLSKEAEKILDDH